MSKANDTCIACGAGKYLAHQRDFAIETDDGHEVRVPKVLVLRCDACSDEVVPARSHHYIDRYVAEQTEQLTPDDVRSVFDKIGRTQQAISADLGFGIKTMSRWLSGLQHPNRAMVFYLRAAAEFPHVYDWVKERAWQRQSVAPRVQLPRELSRGNIHFGDLTHEQLVACASNTNYAREFRGTDLRAA